MKTRLMFICAFLSLYAYGQIKLSPANLQTFCDTIVNKGIKEKLTPAFAISIVQNKKALLKKTYGLSDINLELPADTAKTLFQLGSVGKIFTAIAVLQQVEQGKLDLHKDVNEYLTDFKIENPYSTKLTLFHLLTHTPGLNDQYIGYMARSEQDVKPLAEHLKERMPTIFEEPGKSINYSNYGYALAGHLVELVSGQSFESYVIDHILTPLEMQHTTYHLQERAEKNSGTHYATGYASREDFEKMESFPRHALPAGSIISTTDDMTRFINEIMYPTGKVVTDKIKNQLFTKQFTNHPVLMGYSLGMEEQSINQLHGFGKGGSVPGFLSMIMFFPEQDLSLFMTTNTQTDNFLEHFTNQFFNTFFPDTIPQQKIARASIATKSYEGVYRSERYNHKSIEDLLALYQGKMELYDRGDTSLLCYHNGAWNTYIPLNDQIFQNAKKANEKIVFTLDDRGNITGLSRNVNVGGIYVPFTTSIVPWYDNPVMINEYYVFVVVIIETFLFVLLFRLWVLYKRRNNANYFAGKLFPRGATMMMSAVILCYTAHFIFGFLFLAKNAKTFMIEVPKTFIYAQYLTYIFPLLALGVLWYSFVIWRKTSVPMRNKIYYTILSVCTVIHFTFLYRWHFIGLNF